jgi:O-antigen/teichoic acid export membrane protein
MIKDRDLKEFFFNNKFLIYYNRSAFLKNVSTLATGTIIGQLIIFISSPLLTRLFSASDFGHLALFSSISTIAAIITTGRYELAIGLPKENKDATQVFGLVILLSAIVSCFYLIIIFALKYSGVILFPGNNIFNSRVIYLVPVFTFFAAVYSALIYWNQMEKNYKKITITTISQSIGATIFNIFFGIIGVLSFGLIYGLISGQLCAILFISHTIFRNGYLSFLSVRKLKLQARKYRSFPKYLLISDAFVTISQQVIPIIFSFLFNATIVGFFALANRILRIPSIVLTSSIGNVFRNDAIDAIRKTGNCKTLYISTLKKLMAIAIPVYFILGLVSPWLFTLVFGISWRESGYFAQIICLMVVFDFVASPLNTLFYVIEKKKVYMRIQFLNTLFGIGFIFIGYKLFHNPYYAILFFALNNALFSLLLLFRTFSLSKDNHEI